LRRRATNAEQMCLLSLLPSAFRTYTAWRTPTSLRADSRKTYLTATGARANESLNRRDFLIQQNWAMVARAGVPFLGNKEGVQFEAAVRRVIDRLRESDH